MAIISDSDRHDDDGTNVHHRLEEVERELADLSYALDLMTVEAGKQKLITETILETMMNEQSEKNNEKPFAWKERLVFRYKDIRADQVWRGRVIPVFHRVADRLSLDFSRDSGQTYHFGATFDPDKRFAEHKRSTAAFNAKEAQRNLVMDILYHTTKLEKAADMESRLLTRFPTTINTSRASLGLCFGKPSYFVYLLRYIKP